MNIHNKAVEIFSLLHGAHSEQRGHARPGDCSPLRDIERASINRRAASFQNTDYPAFDSASGQ